MKWLILIFFILILTNSVYALEPSLSTSTSVGDRSIDKGGEVDFYKVIQRDYNSGSFTIGFDFGDGRESEVFINDIGNKIEFGVNLENKVRGYKNGNITIRSDTELIVIENAWVNNTEIITLKNRTEYYSDESGNYSEVIYWNETEIIEDVRMYQDIYTYTNNLNGSNIINNPQETRQNIDMENICIKENANCSTIRISPYEVIINFNTDNQYIKSESITEVDACATLNTQNEVFVLNATVIYPDPTGICFNINSENTTLDLNGFSIISNNSPSSSSNTAVAINTHNITVKNGTIENFGIHLTLGFNFLGIVGENLVLNKSNHTSTDMITGLAEFWSFNNVTMLNCGHDCFRQITNTNGGNFTNGVIDGAGILSGTGEGFDIANPQDYFFENISVNNASGEGMHNAGEDRSSWNNINFTNIGQEAIDSSGTTGFNNTYNNIFINNSVIGIRLNLELSNLTDVSMNNINNSGLIFTSPAGNQMNNLTNFNITNTGSDGIESTGQDNDFNNFLFNNNTNCIMTGSASGIFTNLTCLNARAEGIRMEIGGRNTYLQVFINNSALQGVFTVPHAGTTNNNIFDEFLIQFSGLEGIKSQSGFGVIQLRNGLVQYNNGSGIERIGRGIGFSDSENLTIQHNLGYGFFHNGGQDSDFKNITFFNNTLGFYVSQGVRQFNVTDVLLNDSGKFTVHADFCLCSNITIINANTNHAIDIGDDGIGAVNQREGRSNVFQDVDLSRANISVTSINSNSTFVGGRGNVFAENFGINVSYAGRTNNETVLNRNIWNRLWYYRACVNDSCGNIVNTSGLLIYDVLGSLERNLTLNVSGCTSRTTITEYTNKDVFGTPLITEYNNRTFEHINYFELFNQTNITDNIFETLTFIEPNLNNFNNPNCCSDYRFTTPQFIESNVTLQGSGLIDLNTNWGFSLRNWLHIPVGCTLEY